MHAKLSLRVVALAVTAIAFVLYALTVNRTFGFIDKGELVAVASTFGISHPTGYPTIMLLGFFLRHLIPLRPVLVLNLMASLLTAMSAGMMTVLFADLLDRVGRSPRIDSPEAGKRKGKRARKAAPPDPDAPTPIAPNARIAYAGFAALFVAFTGTWWEQANGFEVYSLHALMMPMVTFFFLRFVDDESARTQSATSANPASRPAAGFTRRGFLFAFALGLSFTNHMTTVLLAPAFLAYYFWSVRGWSALRRLPYLVPPFALGLLPYVLLPIRARMHPYFNWGDPETLHRFVDHVTGKQYRVWMFESERVYEQQTAYFLGRLPRQVAYVGLALSALGVAQLAKRNAKLAALTVLLFVACLLYSGGFSIMEIGPYYMTAVFAVGVMAVAGLAWIHERFGARITLGCAVILAIATCALNYRESDESQNTLVEDMTVNMLDSLPRNALVLSSQWDFWVAGSFYMQAVEHRRPDVLVIDVELLRRSWYLDQLEHDHPQLMSLVTGETERFRGELYKFEHSLPYDPASIEAAYNGLINAIVERSLPTRPVHVTAEVNPRIAQSYGRVPYFLTLQITHDASAYVPLEFPHYRFHFWQGHVDPYAAMVSTLYAQSLQARMSYEAVHGNEALARRYAEYLLSFDPGYDDDSVTDAPLDGEEKVTQAMRYFAEMHRRYQASLARP